MMRPIWLRLTAACSLAAYVAGAMAMAGLHTHDHSHRLCAAHDEEGGAHHHQHAHTHGHPHHHGHSHSSEAGERVAERESVPPVPCDGPLSDDDCVICQYLAQPPLAVAVAAVAEVSDTVEFVIAASPVAAKGSFAAIAQPRAPPAITAAIF